MQKDIELWVKIGNDDQEAFAMAYRFYYKRFYNYGRKFTDNESLVEDAVQETMLVLWDKRHELYRIKHPETYFYTSFRHSLFQKLKQQRKMVDENKIAPESEFSIDQILIAKETDSARREQLEKAISTLTPRQREAIFLRFYECMSYEDVASVLGITTKATYKIMARALLQLKENIGLLLIVALLLELFFSNKNHF